MFLRRRQCLCSLAWISFASWVTAFLFLLNKINLNLKIISQHLERGKLFLDVVFYIRICLERRILWVFCSFKNLWFIPMCLIWRLMINGFLKYVNIFSTEQIPNFRYLYDGFKVWAKDLLWLSLTSLWQVVALSTEDFIEYASSFLSSTFI